MIKVFSFYEVFSFHVSIPITKHLLLVQFNNRPINDVLNKTLLLTLNSFDNLLRNYKQKLFLCPPQKQAKIYPKF